METLTQILKKHGFEENQLRDFLDCASEVLEQASLTHMQNKNRDKSSEYADAAMMAERLYFDEAVKK